MEQDSFENIVKHLHDNSFDLDEYLSLDNDSEVHQQFTEADILASYIGNDSDSDSEDDDAIEIMGQTPVVSLNGKK